MKIELSPGEKLEVTLEGTDGIITIHFDDKNGLFSVSADMPDTSGREGVLYAEHFGPLTREEIQNRISDIISTVIDDEDETLAYFLDIQDEEDITEDELAEIHSNLLRVFPYLPSDFELDPEITIKRLTNYIIEHLPMGLDKDKVEDDEDEDDEDEDEEGVSVISAEEYKEERKELYDRVVKCISKALHLNKEERKRITPDSTIANLDEGLEDSDVDDIRLDLEEEFAWDEEETKWISLETTIDQIIDCFMK